MFRVAVLPLGALTGLAWLVALIGGHVWAEARFFAPPPPQQGEKRATAPTVLAKFPPTLIITATRGFELSSAVYTHSLLVKQGVDAELHAWERMFHGFFHSPDGPESRDCYDVIVRFVDRHLGR